MRDDLAEAEILEVIAGMVFHHDDISCSTAANVRDVPAA
jgi:hypothetical protein